MLPLYNVIQKMLDGFKTGSTYFIYCIGRALFTYTVLSIFLEVPLNSPPQSCSRSSSIMSNLEPTGPAQPSLDQVYQTAGNPAEKEPAEQQAANVNANAPAVGDQRVPSKQSTYVQ